MLAIKVVQVLVCEDGNCHEDVLPCGDNIVLVGQHEYDVDNSQQAQPSEGDEIGGDPRRDEFEEVVSEWGPEVLIGDAISATCVFEIH